MTKSEVISKIKQKTGIEKEDIRLVTEEFLQIVQQVVSTGESIYFRGFGTFLQKRRARKIARNISKNTAMVIEEHYIPSFKPSKYFIAKVRSSTEQEQSNV